LLDSGPADGGNGGTNPAAGHSGSAGDSNAGRSGSAGSPANGGSSASSGDAGMMDMAGAMEAGGDSSEGGTAGSAAGAGTAGSVAGSAGSAGTAGHGGSSGSGGSSGNGGSTGSAGTAGSAGSAGSAGAGVIPASGCAKLTVPLDDAGDRAHFVISLASAIDLSSATTGIVSMRVYVQAGAAGTIFNYVQDSQYHFFGMPTAMRPPLKNQSGWVTLTFPVGQSPATGSIVKSDIRRIGIEINAGPDTAGWSNPTVVYIDSISVMTPALSYTFDASTSVIVPPTGTDPSNSALWQHNGSTDTTATGVILGWQGTCP